jgi:hypothetical protein
LDNHSAHRSQETRRLLDSRSGPFELAFTSEHASGLNHVETFFARMIHSVPRHIRIASRQKTCERTTAFIYGCNNAPVVPKWSCSLAAPDARVAKGTASRSRERCN